MSGSRWVTTPLWLPRSLRLLLYSSSVHSCHLFLFSSVFVRPLPFLSFTVPILAWNVPLISPIFLKRCLVLTILLFLSISLHCSFKKAFLSLLALLWNSEFSWIYLSLSPLPFVFLLSLAIPLLYMFYKTRGYTKLMHRGLFNGRVYFQIWTQTCIP